MKRKIIHIDEEKCNGCGLCAQACHEGAIEMVDGKAKLVSEEYCDGLGDCLPECPTGAIRIVERESKPYDEQAVKKRLEQKKRKSESFCQGTCPSSMTKTIKKKTGQQGTTSVSSDKADVASELNQWPVQLNLVNTDAAYFDDADILIAADCTAYAYGNFHKDFIKGRITLIGCPKLDDNNYYQQKIADILKKHRIKSITVVRMTVPCCNGIVAAVKRAMLDAELIVPYSEIVIGVDGSIQP